MYLKQTMHTSHPSHAEPFPIAGIDAEEVLEIDPIEDTLAQEEVKSHWCRKR